MLQYILSISLVHIYCSYIVFRIDGTEVFLQLYIAYVTAIVVIPLRVTMTHESYDTISYSCLHVGFVVKCSSQCLRVALLSHQRCTYHHLTIEALHIGICEITIAVVHEVLHIAVANTAILLTRDHLQRLYHNLLVACQTDSGEPVLGVVIVFRSYILTSTGLVDTDGRGEREIDIPTRECCLVVINHLIEGVISLFPSRTEGYKQNHLVALLL